LKLKIVVSGESGGDEDHPGAWHIQPMQEASLVGLVVVNRLVAELLHILGKGQTGSIPRLIDLPSRWFVHHQPVWELKNDSRQLQLRSQWVKASR